MTRWIVAGLVVLNVLLGIGLFMRFGGEKTANAQIGGGRADFATVSGIVAGQSYVYILDATNGRLLVVQADSINNKMTLITGRKVGDDLARIGK